MRTVSIVSSAHRVARWVHTQWSDRNLSGRTLPYAELRGSWAISDCWAFHLPAPIAGQRIRNFVDLNVRVGRRGAPLGLGAD